MQVKWIGLLGVLLIAGAIIGYKGHHAAQPQAAGKIAPRVLRVSDMSEADTAEDACAEIIHLVRATRARGIAVHELEPDSKSDLLTRYHVLTIPTVLILDPDGQVVSRFEGEGRDTLKAIRGGRCTEATGLQQVRKLDCPYRERSAYAAWLLSPLAYMNQS